MQKDWGACMVYRILTIVNHSLVILTGQTGLLVRLVCLSLVLVMVRCCIVCIVAVFRPLGPWNLDNLTIDAVQNCGRNSESKSILCVSLHWEV